MCACALLYIYAIYIFVFQNVTTPGPAKKRGHILNIFWRKKSQKNSNIFERQRKLQLVVFFALQNVTPKSPRGDQQIGWGLVLNFFRKKKRRKCAKKTRAKMRAFR